MPTEGVQFNSLSTSTIQSITVGRRDKNNATNARRNTASASVCDVVVYNNNEKSDNK